MQNLDVDRYDRAQRLFFEALELSPRERAGFLRRACGEDGALRGLLSRLLSADGRGGEEIEPVDPLAARIVANLPQTLGRYRIKGVLGWGGMGVVYLAREDMPSDDGSFGPIPPGLAEGRQIALKVLHNRDNSRELRARLDREATALRRLEHSGIARFLDAGLFDSEHGQIPFVAMEYVEGTTLRVCARGPTSDTGMHLRLLAEVCDALSYAHERGVVHRDLKPENIMVDPLGHPRLLDFGLARLTDSSPGPDSFATRAGQLVGTIHYMSPEQAASQMVDRRSDIYSLGVIGYELLGGSLPYIIPDDSIRSAVVAIISCEPQPLSEHSRSYAGAIEETFARVLAKKAEERYQSASEFAADLRRCAEGRSVSRSTRAYARRARDRATPGHARRAQRARTATLAALVIVLITAASLITRRASNTMMPPEQARAVLAGLYPELETAGQTLNVGTREGAQDAIAILDRVHERLLALPTSAPTRHLELFVHWRTGEAHYRLGLIDHDAAAYSRARDSWKQAALVDPPVRALGELDTTRAIVGEIGRLGHHHPMQAQCLALIALSRYETPTAHLREAVLQGSRAMELYNQTDPPNYDPRFGPNLYDRALDSLIVLNDLSEGFVGLGWCRDSLPGLETGLRMLADLENPWRAKWKDRSPIGSFLRRYGMALRRRAELRSSLADADSARSLLQAATAFRTLAESPATFADLKMEMARASLVAAESAPSAERRAARLDEALAELSLARTGAERGNDGFALALVHTLTADVLARVAETDPTRAPTILAQADSLLRQSESTLTAQRYPLQFVERELARGRFLRVRWKLEDREEDRQSAREALRVALDLTPAQENARLHRLIREEQARLELPAP